MMKPPERVLMLVRARPGSARAAAALGRLEELVRDDSPSILVFFHGPAVALASGEKADRWAEAAGFADARLWVCGAAWRRRFRTEPGSAFEISSLARFWSQALISEQIECYGDEG